MIDDPEKTDRLIAELKASLPVETRLTQILMRAIEKQTPDLATPDSCNVVSIFYTGEEGGIAGLFNANYVMSLMSSSGLG